MPRPPGLPKSGGRKKGTPNKTTLHLRDAFDGLGLDLPRSLVTLLPRLSAEKQADVLLQLLAFIYPRRSPWNGPLGEAEEIDLVFVDEDGNE